MPVCPLFSTTALTEAALPYLQSIGTIIAVFDERSQDSGNISYGVEVNRERFFIKTAGKIHVSTPIPYSERVALLRNAVSLSENCDHPSLARPLCTIESAEGPLLVFSWFDGELLHSKLQRFRALPSDEIVSALISIYAIHRDLANAGWVAVDFYDGGLMYDYEQKRILVMDLDMYHRGPFTLQAGRMFGSSRFMAPEESELGAWIDDQTTVFTMGRAASVLLSDGSLDRASFRGSDSQFAIMRRACKRDRHERFGSMTEFYRAWMDASY